MPLPGSNGAFGAWPFVSDMGARVVSGAWASGKVATGGLSAVVLSRAVGTPDFSYSLGDSVAAKRYCR